MILLVSVLSLLICCSPKQEEVERIMEDGVEVAINPSEPSKITGEPSTLLIEKEFSIDTEKDKIAKFGLTDIQGFDVDSEENIYCFKPPLTQEKLVFKFDKNGKFITAFGRRGQGPGEIQFASYQRITKNDEIPIVDAHGLKLLIFDTSGNLLKETRLKLDMASQGTVIPLENGNYLIRRYEGELRGLEEGFSEEGEYLVLSLYNSDLKWLRDVDRLHISGQLLATRSPFMMPVYFWEVSDGRIYVGNSQRGYEIRIFDLKGNLEKKVRKKYNRVEFPKEIRKDIKRITENPRSSFYGRKVILPDYQPPFQCLFFTDDDGRLFLMTFEKGKKTREYIFDIFNSDGIFIGRTSLELYVERYPGKPPLYATAKNNRLYCLIQKESSYKELVIYDMSWK